MLLRKLFFTILLLATISTILFAGTIQQTISIATPTIQQVNGYSRLQLPGSYSMSKVGEPEIPYLGINLLIPDGEEAVSVKVERVGLKTITLNNQLVPQQKPAILSKKAPDFVKPLESAYHLEAFPISNTRGLTTNFYCGHPIASLAVSPAIYLPIKNHVTWPTSIRITIETQVSQRSLAAQQFKANTESVIQGLKSYVINPVLIQPEQGRSTNTDYLIVYDENKLTNWQPLLNYYLQRGYTYQLLPIQSVTSETGRDTPERLRNRIKSIFQQNHFRYLLLAGDDEVIPHRGFNVQIPDANQGDEDIPADLYYAALDGSWDTNNDNLFGDAGETDFVPEMAVGRLSYESDEEIANEINKILHYGQNPVSSEVKKSMMVGEYLWEGPTWGGDYMDELIGNVNMNGYETTGIPTTWTFSKMYDRDMGGEESWDSSDLITMMNQGHNLINHLGHSNTRYNMRLEYGQVTNSNLTNNGTNHNFTVIFTQGCYAGSFDNRDTNVGAYIGDCIAEKFVSIGNGAAAMIAHSRYGWGTQGSTNGASQRLHREFVDALFTEHIPTVGYALQDCKVDNIAFLSEDVIKWVYYETNLLGDPGMMVWTDTPQTVSVQLPTVWYAGQSYFTIPTNASLADVRVMSGSQLLWKGTTSSAGSCQFNLANGLLPGDYQFIVNAANYLPYNQTFTVSPNQGPQLSCSSLEITAPLMGYSQQINITPHIQNVGLGGFTSQGYAILHSDSPYIQVTQDSCAIGQVAAGQTLTYQNGFSIILLQGYEDQTQATLSVETHYGTELTTYNETVTLCAPQMQFVQYQFVGGNNILAPGDVVRVNVTTKNIGHAEALNIGVVLLSEDSHITLQICDSVIDSIGIQSTGMTQMPLQFKINQSCPSQATIPTQILIIPDNGPSIEVPISFQVGLPIYTFEDGVGAWTHEQYNAQFVDQWHLETTDNHTSGGSNCFKFGGSGTANYSNSACGALVSPSFNLQPNTTMTFWHKMYAEVHSQPGYAWDGGYVEISANDGPYELLVPVNDYPYLIVENQASPLAANTMAFSGTFGWREELFNLSSYGSSTVRFRFIFGSDGASTAKGWYIDDLQLLYPVANDDEVNPLVGNQTLAVYPNPVISSTRISYRQATTKAINGCKLFNVKGQLVKEFKANAKNTNNQQWDWDGTDNNHHPVAAGLYFLRLDSDTGIMTKKIVKLK